MRSGGGGKNLEGVGSRGRYQNSNVCFRPNVCPKGKISQKDKDRLKIVCGGRGAAIEVL